MSQTVLIQKELKHFGLEILGHFDTENWIRKAISSLYV